MSFFTRWFWYHRLTWIDVRRMWMLFMIHVCIVAGICLPILILAGLKRGHVTKLREALVTSPTGRQVICFSATRGEIMTDAAVERLQRELPGVDLIIPELEIVAQLRRNGDRTAAIDITLRSSRKGDPILAQHRADVVGVDERGLVLSHQAAEQIGVQTGERVTLVLFRKGGEQADVACRVSVVLAPEATEGNVGFADVPLLNRCQQYIKGFGVAEWGLPTSPELQAPDKYPGYLIFCKKTDDFRERDREFIREKGYRLEEVQDLQRRTMYGLLNAERLEQLNVYYLSTADSATNPRARLSLTPTEIGRWATGVDDVIIPWSEPREAVLEGKKYRLVGCTFPNPTWLRRYLVDPDLPFDYDAEEFRLRVFPVGANPAAASVVQLPLGGEDHVELIVESSSFEKAKPDTGAKPNADPARATLVADAPSKEEIEKRLGEAALAVTNARKAVQPFIDGVQHLKDVLPPEFANWQSMSIRLRKCSENVIAATRSRLSAPDSSDATASAVTGISGDKPPQAATAGDDIPSHEPFLGIVPIQLLAHWDAYSHGVALYDRGRKYFVPPPDGPRYTQVRIYAKTIDHVKAVVDELTRRGFGQISEKTRIDEIQQQDASLALLVHIVMWVVGAFGIVTVWIVLLESTNRKRRDIGILRIMGASGYAVLYMVMLRAAVIGVGAAILASGVGWAACELLTWEPTAAWMASGDSFWAGAWNQLLAWKPVTSARVDLLEDWTIVSVALLCSLLGSIAPAVAASQLDPFDALVHAKDS